MPRKKLTDDLLPPELLGDIPEFKPRRPTKLAQGEHAVTVKRRRSTLFELMSDKGRYHRFLAFLQAGSTWSSAAAALYGVNSIPRAFMLDKNGVIVSTSVRGSQEIESTLVKLLE